MNIGVCVPLNPTHNRPQSSGPVKFVTDEASERAEQALRAAQSDGERSQEDQR